MTEYEVYSYEAFRKKYRDDIREAAGASIETLDPMKLEDYLLRRKRTARTWTQSQGNSSTS